MQLCSHPFVFFLFFFVEHPEVIGIHDFCLILDIRMCYNNSKNKIISTSNTLMFIVDRSRQHVSTLIGSSSGFLFETSL